MPLFLEKKLKKEYGNDPHAIYGTMNKIGAMHGNKETKKGKEMEHKHSHDMKKKVAKKMAHKLDRFNEKNEGAGKQTKYL